MWNIVVTQRCHLFAMMVSTRPHEQSWDAHTDITLYIHTMHHRLLVPLRIDVDRRIVLSRAQAAIRHRRSRSESCAKRLKSSASHNC